MTNDTPRAQLLKAMCDASAEIAPIAKGNLNEHAKYKFASVDDFLSVVGPKLASHGLVASLDLIGTQIIERAGKYGPTFWERSEWSCALEHVGGAVYGPLRREVEVPLTGAQTAGSAQSYVLKMFYRAALNIVTGDPDADAADPDPPTARALVVREAPQERSLDDRAAICVQTIRRAKGNLSDAQREAANKLIKTCADAGRDDLIARIRDERAQWPVADRIPE